MEDGKRRKLCDRGEAALEAYVRYCGELGAVQGSLDKGVKSRQPPWKRFEVSWETILCSGNRFAWFFIESVPYRCLKQVRTLRAST